MNYLNSKEIAKLWGLSDRAVRDYCNKGRIIGAILQGKTWLIPDSALKPTRQKRHIALKSESLLDVLLREKESKLKGGIYHKLQIEMTYNTNHIEGSTITHDQTRAIFETNTIGLEDDFINIDDIIETTNHFRCIDLAIESAKRKLTESLIKQFHYILKSGTSDSKKAWFKVGDYKIIDNEVGGKETVSVLKVKEEMKKLLLDYNQKKDINIFDIIEFHKNFESIHPFQDENGRVGRLIMLVECLKYNIVPILITDDYKQLYYRGLKEYNNEKGYLIDTCLNGQDIMKKYLDYFKIKYNEN